MKHFALVWISLCLLSIATGCTQVKVKTVKVPPPATLMEDCFRPEPQGTLIRHYLYWAAELDQSLADCNRKQAALREWAAH